jgi:hypothetical protein
VKEKPEWMSTADSEAIQAAVEAREAPPLGVSLRAEQSGVEVTTSLSAALEAATQQIREALAELKDAQTAETSEG